MNGVIEQGHQTRKAFCKHTPRAAQRKIDRLVQGLVAVSVDMTVLNVRRWEYLEENKEEVAKDCLDILGQMRERMGVKLKVKIDKEVGENERRCRPSPERTYAEEFAKELTRLQSLGYPTTDFFVRRLEQNQIPMYLNIKTSTYKGDKGIQVKIPKRITDAMSYKLPRASKGFPFTDLGFIRALLWREEQIKKYEEDTGQDARAEMTKIKAKLDQQPRHPFLGGFIKKT